MSELERLTAALADRYQLAKEVGAGGMATVYLARDLKHDRQVAIKVLREDLSASLGKERFLREIRVSAGLQHPHVLPLYDSGEADGLLYYVMPFVDGQSLREKLNKEGELPVGVAARILRDVADALTEAHRQGVVHRDLKPENVMLRGRHALVTDFGVAKALSEATGRQSLTTVGVALGTPAYMAPEQAVADPHVDHRADIYAFGVIAYELLTGHPPFSGMTPQQVLAAHVTTAAEPVTKHRAAIPPLLADLIMRCLEKKPADRWQSADELVPQLEEVLTPSGGITPTDTMPLRAVAPRRRAPLLAGGVAVLLMIAVGGIFVVRGRGSSMGGGDSRSAMVSVGVMPFTEIDAPRGQDFFADGLTDEVIVALSAIPGMQVPGRESSMRFKGTHAPMRAIADSLNVRMLLTATVQRLSGLVRIRYQLVKAEDGFQMAGGVITRPSADVFALYDSVARTISRTLELQLGAGTPAASKIRQVIPEAYQAFLQGKVYLANRKIDSAIVFLERAVALDSTSAESWAALGIAHSMSGPSDYPVATAEAAVAGTRRAVRRAMELDTLSAAVWTAKGRLESMELRWKESLAAHGRAIRLSPDNAMALQSNAIMNAALGNLTEALRLVREARRADPLSFIVGDWAMWLTWMAGQHEEALADGEKLAQMHPRNPRVLRDLGTLYARAGNWPRAARLLSDRLLIMTGDTVKARRAYAGLLNAESRVRTIQETVDATLASASCPSCDWSRPTLLSSAGDVAGARRALAQVQVKPAVFAYTFVAYVDDPGLIGTPEYRRIMTEAGLPVREK